MRYLADLHIHSKYSRATSPQCDLNGLATWAQRKGVRVVGTGDFTHPAWFKELTAALTPDAPGLYKLKDSTTPVSFMLTGEISSIYKRDGAVRKVHSLVTVPSLDAAARVNMRLSRIGNIISDGRPILGLDPRNLLEILLEADPASVLIPAHIWTPWFSMLGSKSGFDSPLECFGDLSNQIFAVETGLSSDPPMNWRVPCLDHLALISNSDLHSPANLARNANLFFGEPDYHRIFNGLRNRDPAICGGTLDLFPEEGKYHLDGHRACNIVLHPAESRALNNLCPVCGKELTLGVLHRVEALADPNRTDGLPPPRALPWRPIIPLPELLAELLDTAATSKKVAHFYNLLLDLFGPETHLLLDAPLDDVAKRSPLPLLDESLRRMRDARVHRTGGYDGVYGQIHVFANGERDKLLGAQDLFHFKSDAPQKKKTAPRGKAPTLATPAPQPTSPTSLDPDQQAAVDAPATQNLLILAGPGSGKTRVLVQRVARLVTCHDIDPAHLLAITFTCRAADEIRQRLQQLNAPVTVSTLHALALRLLREHAQRLGLAPDFRIIDDPVDPSPLAPQPSALTLSQLISLAAHLLDEHPGISLPWCLLCVDEAQDLSRDQWRLLDAFRRRNVPLTLIGDPDQSIYGFRGVDPADFHTFADTLNPRRLTLSRNYRSDRTIVDAASALIAPARTDLSVAPQPLLPATRKIRLFEAHDSRDEALFITRDIRDHLGGIKMESASDTRGLTLGLRDLAILVRTKHQMKILEAVLTDSGLPVQTIGLPGNFLNRPGAGELLKLFTCHAAAAATQDIPALVAGLDLCHAGPEAVALFPELREAAQVFQGGSIKDFLDFLTGWEAVDAYDAAAERVTLMTMHAAKGLEFSVVYVAGCEEGLIPCSDDELAEERRLFYVAITRARHELILTHVRERTLYAQREKRLPSRFLADLPKRLIDKKTSRKTSRGKQLDLFQ